MTNRNDYGGIMAQRIGIVWAVLLIGGGLANAGDSVKPADAEAAPSVRAVLSYLDSLPARREGKLLSGQFPEWHPRVDLKSFAELKTQTERTPAILALDYFETYLDDDAATEPKTHKPARWRELNPLFVEHWRAGGLVTLSIHMTNPWSGKKAWDKSGDLKELVENELPAPRLRAVLDPIAEGLADLQKQDVVVLFRPYHELTGGGFWWCRKDPAAFQALWKATFRYFTQEKKLHNLLWVFNPDSANGQQAMNYYCGNEWADVVSFDIYSTDFAPHVKTYQKLKETGKPFALAEFGPGRVKMTAADFANTTLDYDYSKLPALIQKHFPGTVYFVAWRGPFSLIKNKNAKGLLCDPLIVNREDLAKEPALPQR